MATVDPELCARTTLHLHRSQVPLDDAEPGSEQHPCVVVVRGPQPCGPFFLNKEVMHIGRDAIADICIPEPSISRRHASLATAAGRVRITDNSSLNGTFVNDERLTPGLSRVLDGDDLISLGGTTLKFIPAGEPEVETYARMDRAASTDPLTAVFNRRYLLETLDSEVSRARALGTPYSLVFLDLDHFKLVNDTFGHDAGDAVLQEFVRLIASGLLRKSDVFARYGGEEFVVLLPGTAGPGAQRVAERIRAAVDMHLFTFGARALRVTTSAGVADLRPDMESGADLLRAADRALYSSKQAGRNRVSFG